MNAIENDINELVFKELNSANEKFPLFSSPQEARSVLLNSLKTEVCMTANLHEWRHFFKQRAMDVTGVTYSQMKEITIPLLKELQQLISVAFDDLVV